MPPVHNLFTEGDRRAASSAPKRQAEPAHFPQSGGHPHCEQPEHLFYLPSEDDRDALIAHFRPLDTLVVFHYQPLHLSEIVCKFGGWLGPVTQSVSGRLVLLPLYTGMTEAEQSAVWRG